MIDEFLNTQRITDAIARFFFGQGDGVLREFKLKNRRRVDLVTINEEGWINFPDWQGRIFRNRPNIRWQHKVHEMITGFQTYATLPTDKPFCILHPKTIEKQVEQNKFYNEEISGIRK